MSMQPKFPRLRVADGFWSRFKGLMFSAPLLPEQALLITHCASVHTCFMRYALDVVYLDRDGVAVKLVAGLKPWRMSWGGAKAVQALELAAGGIARHAIRVGDSFAASTSTQGIS